jgi:hypothetical protein
LAKRHDAGEERQCYAAARQICCCQISGSPAFD